jgi:hypothetical protein
VRVFARNEEGLITAQAAARRITSETLTKPPRISHEAVDILSLTIGGPLKVAKEKYF